MTRRRGDESGNSFSPRHPVSQSPIPPILPSQNLRIGVDTGGTFTDFVFDANGEIGIFKLASTPADPSIAITQGLRRIRELTKSASTNFEIVHGTTVGTNALLQRRGARTALITTKGFEDVLVIGRQARPELYNLDAVRPPPLVPDELRYGLPERISSTGEVLEHLAGDQLRAIIATLKDSHVESVGISLLFSFANPQHEIEVAAALASLNVPLSISHQILPEYREYERTSTVTINAYLQPLMGSYLERLSNSLKSQEPSAQTPKDQTPILRVMQSSGGSISAAAAANEPVRTILSGPAGGIVGALQIAHAAGFDNIISFDMGGTSTDVALCEHNGLRTTNEAIVAGLPVAIPVLDIHTVGAGGGSIARVDEGGSLRVGPESAGADPGPACYGRSFLPTVTDAHVVLGHFGGSGLLGGEFELDEKRAKTAMSELAKSMSQAAGREVRASEAAQGVVAIVNSNMERALRRISVERGYDPRDFSLVPFGGAGGLHAVDLARALGIPRVIVPRSPGALSAIGVLAANVVKDHSQTVMLKYEPGVEMKLDSLFKRMEQNARAVLREEGFSEDRQRHERSLAMRYAGQSFELEIKVGPQDLASSFHNAHLARYGYAQENPVEIVSIRLRSSGLVEQRRQRAAKVLKRSEAPTELTQAFFDGKRISVGIYQREKLRAGMKLKVPCIVKEYSATTLVPTGCKLQVDRFGNLIIQS